MAKIPPFFVKDTIFYFTNFSQKHKHWLEQRPVFARSVQPPNGKED